MDEESDEYEEIEEEIEVEVDDDYDEENPDEENPDEQNPDEENPDEENPDEKNPDGEFEEIDEEIEEMEEEGIEKKASASPDVSRGMELEVNKEPLISESFGQVIDTTGESKFSIASETKDEATIYADETRKMGTHLVASDGQVSVDEEKDLVASRERGELNSVNANNGNTFLDHEYVTADPSVVDNKEVAVATSSIDGYTEKANGVVDAESDIGKLAEQSREDINEGQTSSSLPQIRLRSPSPIAEFNTMNKRPTLVCDFFAKGWCIKGSSCKFLHVKDRASINSQKSEGDEGKIELRSDIGVRDSNERAGVTISPVSLKRSQAREVEQSHHFNTSHEILPQRQDSSRSNFSYKDFGGDNLKLNPVEDNSNNRSRHFPDIHSTLGLSTPSSGHLPTFSSSTWTRAHFPLGSDPIHAYGSTSLLRSSSPFSGSESKNHSLKDFSMDLLPVVKNRNKISFDDWEPSEPFRPSFPYTKNLLAPLALYDPIRDSIDQPKSSDRLPKLPSRLETTITHTHTHRSADKDPALSKTIVPERGSDKKSISAHNRYLLSTEGETMRIYNDEQTSGSNMPNVEKGSMHDEQNSGSNLPKEENSSRHLLDKDRAKAKKVHDSIPRLQKNGISRNKELNPDTGRDVEQRESKEMKIFRVALIDFVKELVRPTWLEGRVSKDAHKKIVKNAVEKVLSTVQPNETPSTEESINQYLSISKPKMAKLVEAYVVKYGKT